MLFLGLCLCLCVWTQGHHTRVCRSLDKYIATGSWSRHHLEWKYTRIFTWLMYFCKLQAFLIAHRATAVDPRRRLQSASSAALIVRPTLRSSIGDRCAHLEQSSDNCNRVSISTDFSDEIENWTVSKIVHNCQSSVTQYFVTWPWSYFTYVTIMVIRSLLTDWLLHISYNNKKK